MFLWLKTFRIDNLYTEHELFLNVAATFIVLLCYGFTRKWYTGTLPDSLSSEEKRSRMVLLRNRATILLVIVLFSLWATEIKTLAVSLLAIAVALVVATKELIMSAIGGMIRAATKRYTIGDRISVHGVRGDVIDITLLTTIIMALGPGARTNQYTGKTISLPNSYVLTEPVEVETVAAGHTFHNMEIPVYPEQGSVAKAASVLETSATAICAPYQNEATEHLSKWGKLTSINLLSAQPRVVIHSESGGRWWLTLRVVVPVKERLRVEQQIIAAYLTALDVQPNDLQSLS